MKRGIAAVSAFVLLSFAFTALAAPAEEKKMSRKAEKLMSKALEAIKEKQPDQAIDLLQQVVALAPENAMVRHNLGVLYFEKGMADIAIASFEEALRLQPGYQNAQLALRQALFETGKAASARQEYDKANGYLLKFERIPLSAGATPEDRVMEAMAHYLLGYNHFNLKQYPPAGEYFAKAQASAGLEQDNPELYANATYFLGMSDHVLGRYESSNGHFQRYLALAGQGGARPEFATNANYFIGANLFRLLEARLAKGDVAKMAESAAEILPFLNAAVENRIPSEDAYVMQGNCHVYRKEYDQAVQSYQLLIERFPQSPQLKSYQAFLEQLQKMQAQEAKARKRR